jgi:hypothetical protein
MQAKSPLAAMFGRALLGPGVEHALPGSRWGGEDEELAVGEDSVDVEEEKSDFAGAGLSGEFCHREILASAICGTENTKPMLSYKPREGHQIAFSA